MPVPGPVQQAAGRSFEACLALQLKAVQAVIAAQHAESVAGLQQEVSRLQHRLACVDNSSAEADDAAEAHHVVRADPCSTTPAGGGASKSRADPELPEQLCPPRSPGERQAAAAPVACPVSETVSCPVSETVACPVSETVAARWAALVQGRLDKGRWRRGNAADINWGLHPLWSLRKEHVEEVPPARSSARLNVSFADTSLHLRRRDTTAAVSCFRHGDTVKDDGILQRFVLHPDKLPWTLWALTGLCILLLDMILNPMETVGLLGPMERNVAFLCITYWVLDVVVQLLTGFHDGGIVDLRPRQTVRRYARSWLLPDAVILGLDVTFLLLDDVERAATNTGSTLRNIRAVRLLRLVRAHKALALAESVKNRIFSEYVSLVLKILKLLGLLLLISHYIACCWYGLSVLYDDGPTWTNIHGFDTSDKLYSYVMALHWALTQFTPATNNVYPENMQERSFAVCIVLVGLVVFSSFVSSVTNAVNQLWILGINRRQERAHIRQFISRWNVSTELGHRIQSFFSEVKGNSRKPVREEDLTALRVLPESLRIRLHEEIYMPVLQSHHALNEFVSVDQALFVRICHQAMCMRHFLPRQDVFIDGTESTCVHSVVSGHLGYSYCVADQSRNGIASSWGLPDVSDLVEPHAWLSEAALWVHWVHVGQLTARSQCELAEISCDSFRGLVASVRGSLFSCLRKYAVFFVLYAEESCRDCRPMTDLSPDQRVLERLARRARRASFAGGRSSERSHEERQRNMALQLLERAFSRSRW